MNYTFTFLKISQRIGSCRSILSPDLNLIANLFFTWLLVKVHPNLELPHQFKTFSIIVFSAHDPWSSSDFVFDCFTFKYASHFFHSCFLSIFSKNKITIILLHFMYFPLITAMPDHRSKGKNLRPEESPNKPSKRQPCLIKWGRQSIGRVSIEFF